ncbi:MAG: NUDIX domain-containing protein [Clostridia bacterium]|nr:NUDIX domain-containing protein [Clostridia bacterium]
MQFLTGTLFGRSQKPACRKLSKDEKMQTEKWDILNEKGEPTGRTAVRGNYPFKKGEYHLVVHIWIISPDGRILIQRRSEEKKLMPGEWAATGGAAIAGEDSFTAASRELYEELGIKSDRQILRFVTRMKRRNSFLDIWSVISDMPADKLTLQASEVAEAKWVSRGEFEDMIKKGEYHNYGEEYFSLIFDKTAEVIDK